jgi:hypothetical protein
MPEPGGMPLEDAEALLSSLAARASILGAGLTGLRADEANVAPLTRLTAALGL